MQGPYYLGGESQAPIGNASPPQSLNASDIGLPNSFSLQTGSGSASSSPSDSHRDHRSSRHHGHSSRSKRSKDYVVSVAEEMPEGFQAQKAEQKKADDKADPLGKIVRNKPKSTSTPLPHLKSFVFVCGFGYLFVPFFFLQDLRDIAPSEQLQHARHRSAASDHSHSSPKPTSPPDANYLKADSPSQPRGPTSPSQPAPSTAAPAGDKKYDKHRSSRDKDGHRSSSHRSSSHRDKDKEKDRGRSSHRSHHSSSRSKDSLHAKIVKAPIDPAGFINLLKTQLAAMTTGSINNSSISRAVHKISRTNRKNAMRELGG